MAEILLSMIQFAGASARACVASLLLAFVHMCAAHASGPLESHSVQEHFKISLPSHWKKADLRFDGALYANTRAKNRQILIVRSVDLGQTTSLAYYEAMEKHAGAIAVGREKLLYKLRIGRFTLLEKNRVRAKNPKFGDMIVLNSRFDGLLGSEVQMIERQYVANQRLYQVAYFEESPAITDRAAVNRVLDTCEPIYKPNRVPANNEVLSGTDRKVVRCPGCAGDPLPDPGSLWWYKRDDPRCSKVKPEDRPGPNGESFGPAMIGRSGVDCVAETARTWAKLAGSVANLGRTGFDRAQSEGHQVLFVYPQTAASMGIEPGAYKIDRALVGKSALQLKTIEQVIRDEQIKPLSPDQSRAQLQTGLTVALAELGKFMQGKDATEIYARTIAAVVGGIAEQWHEFRCVKLEKQISLACQLLASTVPPGGVGLSTVGKVASRAPLVAEAQAARAAFEKSAALPSQRVAGMPVPVATEYGNVVRSKNGLVVHYDGPGAREVAFGPQSSGPMMRGTVDDIPVDRRQSVFDSWFPGGKETTEKAFSPSATGNPRALFFRTINETEMRDFVATGQLRPGSSVVAQAFDDPKVLEKTKNSLESNLREFGLRTMEEDRVRRELFKAKGSGALRAFDDDLTRKRAPEAARMMNELERKGFWKMRPGAERDKLLLSVVGPDPWMRIYGQGIFDGTLFGISPGKAASLGPHYTPSSNPYVVVIEDRNLRAMRARGHGDFEGEWHFWGGVDRSEVVRVMTAEEYRRLNKDPTAWGELRKNLPH